MYLLRKEYQNFGTFSKFQSYRAMIPDIHRNSIGDVSAKDLQNFMGEYEFDPKLLKNGYASRTLATFENTKKISINLYDIGKNGAEETTQHYYSIYNGGPDFPADKKIKVGILRNDEGDVHFELIQKLQVILTPAHDVSHGHAKMCFFFGIEFHAQEWGSLIFWGYPLQHFLFHYKSQ
jgi:hypothetical protein